MTAPSIKLSKSNPKQKPKLQEHSQSMAGKLLWYPRKGGERAIWVYFSAKRSPHFILRLLIIQLLSIHHTTSSHRLLSMTAPSIKLSKIDPKLIQNLRNPAEGWLENSYCTPGGEGGGGVGRGGLSRCKDFWLHASLEAHENLHYHHMHTLLSLKVDLLKVGLARSRSHRTVQDQSLKVDLD